jgi:hypothetical protein
MAARRFSKIAKDRPGGRPVSSSSESKPASTELTGGAGFTYEDTVVAYYLAQLLRRERAAGQSGVVASVAVQQQGHGNPMDDLVVEFDDVGTKRVLGLQIKRSVTISGAESNEEFRGIISAAAKTQALASFTKGADKCGFVVEHVTPDTLRTLKRLIDWAVASTASVEFEERFLPTGAAAKAERDLRDALKPVIGAVNADEEVSFYKHFVAFRIDGLEEGGMLRTEVVNRLQELIAINEGGQDVLLFDRLCRIAREGAGKATKWSRALLLAQLRGVTRLKVIPYLGDDIHQTHFGARRAFTANCSSSGLRSRSRASPSTWFLKSYALYYNETRTHLALGKDAPVSRPVQRVGVIRSRAILGGLHHHSTRA